MVSSHNGRQRKEKILDANRIMLRLDDVDFQGTIRFSYKKGEGVMSYAIEEHGSLSNGHSHTELAVMVVKNGGC